MTKPTKIKIKYILLKDLINQMDYMDYLNLQMNSIIQVKEALKDWKNGL